MAEAAGPNWIASQPNSQLNRNENAEMKKTARYPIVGPPEIGGDVVAAAFPASYRARKAPPRGEALSLPTDPLVSFSAACSPTGGGVESS
jgi:hypothetical protein